MKLNLESHPNYGQKVTLWVYAPSAKDELGDIAPKFISHPQYRNIRFDTEGGKLLSALKWLNVGYFLLPTGVDPNDQDVLKPILVDEKFLNSMGCTNHYFLSSNDLAQASLYTREDPQGVVKMIGKGITKDAAKKPTKTEKPKSQGALDDLINRLTTDKVSKSELQTIRVKILINAGYNIKSDDTHYWISAD